MVSNHHARLSRYSFGIINLLDHVLNIPQLKASAKNTWAVVNYIGSNSIADVRVQQKQIRIFHWTLSVVIFTKMLRVPAFKDIKAWFICNGYCTYNGETRPASVRYVELKTCSLCISSLHVFLKLANG